MVPPLSTGRYPASALTSVSGARLGLQPAFDRRAGEEVGQRPADRGDRQRGTERIVGVALLQDTQDGLARRPVLA